MASNRPKPRHWYGKPYPWIKVTIDTYHGAELADLDGTALAVLNACRALASLFWWDAGGVGWLVTKTGAAKTPAVIARTARFPLARTRRALAELVDQGALIFRDGCFGVVGFGASQDSEAAARRRKSRDKSQDKSRDKSRGVLVDPLRTEILESSSKKKKEEGAATCPVGAPRDPDVTEAGTAAGLALLRAAIGPEAKA